MGTMYLMTGRPGAGKTEFVTEWTRETCDCMANTFAPVIFCPDDYYAKINGDELIHENAFEVWIAMYRDIDKAMREGRDVIIDTNSPTETMREQFIDWFPEFSEYILVYINANYKTCNENNRRRRRVIPQDKFDRLFASYRTPLDDRSLGRWNQLWVYNNTGAGYKLKEHSIRKDKVNGTY